MQRYHDTNRDPLPIQSPQHDIERARLDEQVAGFLANGGEIEQVGYQMRDTPAKFVIDAQRSPVYAHLYVAPKPAQRQEPNVPTTGGTALVTNDDQSVKHAALIMASAALGESPYWIAKKYHMTEKHVRQIARDYSIQFGKQR